MWLDFVLIGQVAVLSATAPLSIIAAYGYRDTPFGRVLAALVPISVLYAAFAAIRVVRGGSQWDAVHLVVGSAALALVGYAVFELVTVLTERRKL